MSVTLRASLRVRRMSMGVTWVNDVYGCRHECESGERSTWQTERHSSTVVRPSKGTVMSTNALPRATSSILQPMVIETLVL